MSEQTPNLEVTAKQAQQLLSGLPLLRYFAVISLLINTYLLGQVHRPLP